MIPTAPVWLLGLLSTSLSGEALQVTAPGEAAQEEETLEWLDDYDEAIALAKQTGQPLFLEFRCAP